MKHTTTTDNPFLDEYEIGLIHEGFTKVEDLYILDITPEVPAIEDLSDDEAGELQDRVDELNYAIEEVERIRDELVDAYQELMGLIG